MGKLSFNEIKKMLKSCGIGFDYDTVVSKTSYVGIAHKHNWDHGYDTYYGYNGHRREFYGDLSEVCNCLTEYLRECSITSLIVFPFYHDGPFVHNYRYCKDYNDIIDEIRDFLRANDISVGTKSGAVINASDKDAVSMVVEGAFRGASRLCLFSPERKIVIEPDHHFQVCIWTPDPLKEKETLSNIISGFSDLSLFYSE